jgi:hypothetical protein
MRSLALVVLVSTAAASTQAGPASPNSTRSQPTTQAVTRAVQLRTAAYRLQGAPSAVVHVPPGFDPRPPLHLVVYLHGYSGCARVLANAGPTRCREGDVEREGWNLTGHHDDAGTNTLFVIPQLAFMKRNGRPGCFAQRGCFRRFLQELLGETLVPELGGARTLRDVASLTLVAHSAGYKTALAILEHGEVDTQLGAVVLMDALYSGTDGYARWLLARGRPDARLLSMHIGRGSPARESALLLRRVRRALGPARAGSAEIGELRAALAGKRLVVTRTSAPHRLVPAQHLAEVLVALGLPRRAVR